ncbi:MAG: hypothetical protein R3F61_04595 [Myxococcota bacterium]
MLTLLLVACGPAEDAPVVPVVPVDTDLPADTGEPVDPPDTGAPPEDTDPPGPPPCVDDALEDNDDLDHALPWTDQALAVLDGDPDYWTFELQPGQTRRIDLAFDHSRGNVDLTVYDALYIAIATSYSFSDDESVEVTNPSSVPTTGRIRVLLRDPGCNAYTVSVVSVGSGEP